MGQINAPEDGVTPVGGQKQAFGLDLAKVRSTPRAEISTSTTNTLHEYVELVTGRDAIKMLRERGKL
jgi:hypothetical protein